VQNFRHRPRPRHRPRVFSMIENTAVSITRNSSSRRNATNLRSDPMGGTETSRRRSIIVVHQSTITAISHPPTPRFRR
jgi:hypothetical protein